MLEVITTTVLVWVVLGAGWFALRVFATDGGVQ
jgi:hypothetical protein